MRNAGELLSVDTPIARTSSGREQYVDLRIFATTPKVRAWRRALAGRESVINAVAADYPERLSDFLRARGSHLSTLMTPKMALAEA
jgi:glutathione S-transferase